MCQCDHEDDQYRLLLPDGDAICSAVAADLPHLERIERVSQSHPWSLRQFEQELANPASRIDLYLSGGLPVAFLCSWLIAGELQIQNLATAPEFRRHGIAARLLEHVLARSRGEGFESAWLEVRISNAGAIALYRNYGFADAGVRPRYYADGEDALVMGLVGESLNC